MFNVYLHIKHKIMQKHILLIITSFILLTSPVFSQTIYVSGDITTNTTWTADTVKITGDVSVNSTVTLTINPGTYIEFQGYFHLYVLGRILAVANNNDSITFTINDTTGYVLNTSSAGGWGGISLQTSANTDTSLFCYCNFEFCKNTAINSWKKKTRIENNTFNNNWDGLNFFQVNYSVVRFNTIKNCLGIAIKCDSNYLVIISNNFLYKNALGIYALSSAEIENNKISYCQSGIEIFNNNSTVIHNEIKNNVSGITLRESNSFISENIISNNTSVNSSTSGGIFCQGSSPVISNNEISNNTSAGGAGIFVTSEPSGLHSNPLIILNKICNNQATGSSCGYNDGGSALLCVRSSALIINNIIANNLSAYYGTISCLDSSDALIINNTIVNNNAYVGGGISVFQTKLNALNNILWGNQATFLGNQLFIGSADTISQITNCCFQDTLNSNIYNISIFQNNISNDPLFVNPSAGVGIGYDGLAADWSLQPNSPCINAGKTDTTGLHLDSLDIAGNIRILGGRIDIGAFEHENDTITSHLSSSGEFGLFVYPNPAKDYINLIILNTLKGGLQLNISDMSGKTLYVENITNNDLYYNKAISLTSFPKGVYVMHIAYENGKEISKTLIKE